MTDKALESTSGTSPTLRFREPCWTRYKPASEAEYAMQQGLSVVGETYMRGDSGQPRKDCGGACTGVIPHFCSWLVSLSMSRSVQRHNVRTSGVSPHPSLFLRRYQTFLLEVLDSCRVDARLALDSRDPGPLIARLLLPPFCPIPVSSVEQCLAGADSLPTNLLPLGSLSMDISDCPYCR